jgi:hypothetical protein
MAVGLFWLVRYQMTPGAPAAALAAKWPSGLNFARNSGGLTLVMLVHPQCPCSRASMHELSELISRSEGRLAAHVLFVQPAGSPAGWCDGDLWNDARAVRGLGVSIDKDGRDAAILGASTSGEVLVFDADGLMRFSGGITDGRGHEGDNPGYLAILALIRGHGSNISGTPVYGCSLGVCQLKKEKR